VKLGTGHDFIFRYELEPYEIDEILIMLGWRAFSGKTGRPRAKMIR